MPDTSYSVYTWRGTQAGGNQVWRKLRPTSAAIAEALATRFAYGVPIAWPDGSSVGLSYSPVCLIQFSASARLLTRRRSFALTLNSEGGYWLTDKPIVAIYGTEANLDAGSASTDGIPVNVIVYAAVYSGEIQVASPPDSSGAPTYTGTASTVYGLDETMTVTVPSWRDPINATSFQGYADSVAASVQDAILELTVPLNRFDPRALVPGSAINVVDALGRSTGLETAALPLTDAEYSFPRNRGYWRHRL